MNNLDVIAYELCNNIYLNITNRCTAECIFCKKRDSNFFNESIVHCSKNNVNIFPVKSEPLISLDNVIFGYNLHHSKEPIYGRNLRLSREPDTQEIFNELESCDFSKYNEAVFTGLGEPIIRFNEVLEITRWLTHKGISVRLDTIGHAKLLYPERNVAKELANSGMKEVSISLNAHDEATYNYICRPKFKNSYNSRFEFACEVIKAGMGLRFTIADLPIVDINKCRRIAWQYNANFKVRPFW